jgi:geranyl-CoA carboxylase beta subunit
MAQIESNHSTSSDSFQANRQGMLDLLAQVRAFEERTVQKSAASKPRFDKRQQLLPRERLSLLLDPGTPFLELSTLAGLGLDHKDLAKSVPGGGVIAGIGVVSGVRCMVNVSDSGIDAGALQPMGLDKQLRVQELALENKLPFIQLVESAGANLMTYRVEDFVRGGSLFRNIARLSAAGLPVVTVTHGSSTAGGAYQTGLSDYIIMVRDRSRAFLAGPPLLLAATGEVATEEELGGAWMHTSISGLGDYLAEDDRDAIRLAREVMAHIDWDRITQDTPRSFKPPRYDAEELLGVMPLDHKRPVDMKEVIARIADDSDFLEFGANYGSATVCGHIMLPKPHAYFVFEQHHRLHGGQGFRRSRHHQTRLENDPSRHQRHRAANHHLLRRFVWRGQLRHVWTRLSSTLLFLLAERENSGHGRRASRQNHGHRHRGRDETQRRGGPCRTRRFAAAHHRTL